MRRLFTILPLAILLGTGIGCSDPVAPTPESVAGTYSAVSFRVQGSNVLSAGGSLTLSLTTAGAVSGRLFVPESVGGPLDANMTGTYEIVDRRLVFDQEADTFVRDAEWTWEDGVLAGVFVSASSGAEVVVRMER